jgi:WD40 repeat protein
MGIIEQFLEALVHVTNNITLIAFLAVIMLAILITVLQKDRIYKNHLKVIQLIIVLFSLIFLAILVLEMAKNWPRTEQDVTPSPEAGVIITPSKTHTATVTPPPTMTSTACPNYPLGLGEQLVFANEAINTENISKLRKIADWPYADGNHAFFIEYSQDSRYLILGLEQGLIRVVNASNGELIDEDSRHEGSTLTDVETFASPSGSINRFATSSFDTTAYIWDFNGHVISKSHTLERDNLYAVYTVAFSPLTSDLAATGDGNNRVNLWSLPAADSKDFRHEYTWLTDEEQKAGDFHVKDCSFSNDGEILAASSSDGSIQIFKVHRSGDLCNAWLAAEGRLPIDGPGDKVFQLVEFSPSERDKLYAASNYGSLSIFDIDLGELTGSAKSSGPLVDIDISKDGTLVAGVAVAEETSFVHVWDQDGGGSLFTRYLNGGHSVSIAPNGRLVAVADQMGIHIYAIVLCVE